MRAQVHGHGLIPLRHGVAVEFVASVVGGIVDQHGNIAMRLGRLRYRGLERFDIGNVAFDEKRSAPVFCLHLFDKARGVGALHEGRICALRHEAVGQRRADARSAAGDEDAAVPQVVEGCVSCHQ